MGVALLKEDTIQATFSFDTSASDNWHSLFDMHLGRWLCSCDFYDDRRMDYFCFDLKSFRAVPNLADSSMTDLLYDRFSVFPAPGEEYVKIDIAAALSALNSPSYEPTERDGYPVNCIKCGDRTVSAEIYWDNDSTSHLGRAVCIKCCIRFSKSNERWKCFRVVDKVSTCDNLPFTCCDRALTDTRYYCSAAHSLKAQYSGREIESEVTGGKNRQVSVAVSVKLLQKKKDYTTMNKAL